MTEIKEELKKIILEIIMPESEEYLKELHIEYKETVIPEEEKETIRDMESFLVELQNILLAIEQNKITDDEAHEIFQKITIMINEHSKEDPLGH